MRLTSKGRYAVMALVDLARFDGINPVSLRDISLRQGISLDYLEQIFSKLRKKEIVQSVRGTQGGYILNRKAKEIKLTNIFDAVDEKVKTVQCKKESKKGCNGKSTKCLTHNLWDELETHINNFFDKDQDTPSATLVISGDIFKVYFDENVDLNLIKENLQKRQNKYQEELDKISQRLSNKGFVDRAPKNIVEQEKNNYSNLEDNIKKISLTIESL